MGEFPHISPGDNATRVLFDSRWINGVTRVLEGGGERPDELPGKGRIIEVMLTESLPAAAWDKATKSRTPVWASAPRMYTVAGKDKFNPNAKVSFWHKFATAVDVTPGKGRFGYVLDRRLIGVDCTEVDIV